MTQEKKQKKVKAPGTPAKLAGYRENFLASVEAVRDAGQVGRVPGELPCLGRGRHRGREIWPGNIFVSAVWFSERPFGVAGGVAADVDGDG